MYFFRGFVKLEAWFWRAYSICIIIIRSPTSCDKRIAKSTIISITVGTRRYILINKLTRLYCGDYQYIYYLC